MESQLKPDLIMLQKENEALKMKIKSIKKLLLDRQHIFDIIIENTLAGYWDWDFINNKKYLSPQFIKMYGYQSDGSNFDAEGWKKIIHPEDYDNVLALFQKHVTSKGVEPYSAELRYIHKNGRIIWVHSQGKVIEWTDKGMPKRMIGCHVDITALKKIQLALIEQTQVLAQKNDELEQINYAASHDLQEPLRTVTSYAELLEKRYAEQLGDEGKLFLHFITDSSRRMRTLIKDLLEYSRIGQQKKHELFDSNELVKDVIKDLATAINESEAVIRVEKLPTVMGNRTEIGQLFQNLLTNALKFIPKGSSPLIQVGSKEQKNSWHFFVKDNGIGISKEQQEKIFVIFKRLNSQHEYKGTGIGLALCKKIVELHQGQIWTESKTGTGSTFYFSIPKTLKDEE